MSENMSTETPSESARFQAHAAQIEAAIRSEIERQPITVDTSHQVQGLLGPIAPLFASTLARLDRLNLRVSQVSAEVKELRVAADVHDVNLACQEAKIREKIFELRNLICELKIQHEDLHLKLDPIVGLDNDPKEWATNMARELADLKKEKAAGMEGNIDEILRLLRSNNPG